MSPYSPATSLRATSIYSTPLPWRPAPPAVSPSRTETPHLDHQIVLSVPRGTALPAGPQRITIGRLSARTSPAAPFFRRWRLRPSALPMTLGGGACSGTAPSANRGGAELGAGPGAAQLSTCPRFSCLPEAPGPPLADPGPGLLARARRAHEERASHQPLRLSKALAAAAAAEAGAPSAPPAQPRAQRGHREVRFGVVKTAASGGWGGPRVFLWAQLPGP